MPEILQLTEGVLNVRLFGALEEQNKPPRRKQPKEACKKSRPLRIEHTRLESQPLFPSSGPSISTTCFFLFPWLVCAMAVNLFMAQESIVFSVRVAGLVVICRAAPSELCRHFRFLRCRCCYC